MTIATTLQQHLANEGVRFDVLMHAHTQSASETAQASHISGRHIAKAVVLKDAQGFLLAVLPASHHIHLNALRRLVEREVELASEEEAACLFGDCETGALPADGDAYGVPTVVDETLAEQPDIYIEGGDHRTLLHIKGDEFRHLMTGARMGRFSGSA